MATLSTGGNLLISDGDTLFLFYDSYYISGDYMVTGSCLSVDENVADVCTYGAAPYQISCGRSASLDISIRFSRQYEFSNSNGKNPSEIAERVFLEKVSMSSLMQAIYRKMEKRNA